MTWVNDYGDLGGDWTADWRHLKVEMSPWIDGRQITFRLGMVHKAALAADKLETKANLMLLAQEVAKLEREVETQVHLLTKLRKEVGLFTAAVHQARTLAADKPDPLSPEELERQKTEDLLRQSEIGLDRTARLYGLDRHKPKR